MCFNNPNKLHNHPKSNSSDLKKVASKIYMNQQLDIKREEKHIQEPDRTWRYGSLHGFIHWLEKKEKTKVDAVCLLM